MISKDRRKKIQRWRKQKMDKKMSLKIKTNSVKIKYSDVETLRREI